jgi:hypothetical protein
MPSLGGSDILYDPTVVDSDGDGVVDKSDYAPWDPRVQEEADVFDARWTRDLTEEMAKTTDTPIRDWVAAQQQSGIVARNLMERQLSRISSYNATTAEVTVNELDAMNQPYAILLLVRGFPQQAIFHVAASETLAPRQAANVTFTLPAQTETTLPVYYTAYRVPVSASGSFEFHQLSYLHETNPFRVTDTGEIQSISTPHQKRAFETEYTSRTPVEGGYILSLSGRSNGDDWEIAYFVSRAAYEYRKLASRGRSREEYARQAVQETVMLPFTRILTQEAARLGRDSLKEQAEFIIDVIQSFPYVLDDVGTGFDDYAKFAEETLVEMEGDCEDTSILLAVLLYHLGFDVVLIEFPSHIGVGIAGDFDGAYVQYDGGQYHYIETTAEGWAVGDIPDVLDTSSVYISTI